MPRRVTNVLVSATADVEGVLAEPAPSVMAVGFGNGTVGLELRWWHGPRLGDEKQTRDRVVRALAAAMPTAGITQPPPTVVLDSPEPTQSD